MALRIANEGQYETLIISNEFQNPLNTDKNTTHSNWQNSMATSKFLGINDISAKYFMWGVVSCNFVNTIYNVYSANDTFVLIEDEGGEDPPIETVHTIPHGQYNIVTLTTELQTLINLDKEAPGTYAVTYNILTRKVTITYTPFDGGDEYTFSILNSDERTIIENNTYHLFGLQNNNTQTSGHSMVASNPYNVWFGLNNIYLCCSAVSYQTHYINNNSQNDINVSNLGTVILSVPMLANSDDFIFFQPKDVLYYKTQANPYQQTITWSLRDAAGNLVENMDVFEFLLSAHTYGKQDTQLN